MANWLTDAWFWVATGKTASAIEEETAANNAKLDARNADLLARGVWGNDQAAIADSQRNAEDYYHNAGENVLAAAGQGAAEGLATMADSVRETANTVAGGALSTIWRAIPWWIWLGAGLYLAWRFGALRNVKLA